jgi:hypothetical protein
MTLPQVPDWEALEGRINQCLRCPRHRNCRAIFITIAIAICHSRPPHPLVLYIQRDVQTAHCWKGSHHSPAQPSSLRPRTLRERQLYALLGTMQTAGLDGKAAHANRQP